MSKQPYRLLYGAIFIAAVSACIAFIQRWDTVFFLAVAALFYVGLWALGRASTMERESHARFMEAQALRERTKGGPQPTTVDP